MKRITDHKPRNLLAIAVVLLLVLLIINPNVSRAASSISKGSSSSSSGNTNIGDYIGQEEFLMESGAGAGVNARFLATNYLSYDTLQTGQAVAGNKYAIALNQDNRGCQIYDRCRQG